MSGRPGRSRLTPAALMDRLRARDPGLAALRRAARAAIVMPACFALSDVVIGNGTMALFAAFGALSTLLFVDFGGTMQARVTAQTLLVATAAVLVTLGTLASQTAWLAVAGTVVVAFGVSFAGIVSSALASATTPMLVAFVLAVVGARRRVVGARPARRLPALRRRVDPRDPPPVAGAGARTAARRDRRELPAPRRAAAGGGRARPRSRRSRSPRGGGRRRGRGARRGRRAPPRVLRHPVPARRGVTTASRVLVRAVDQAFWMDTILERMPPDRAQGGTGPAVCEIKLRERGAARGRGAAGRRRAGRAAGLPAARARLGRGARRAPPRSTPLAGSVAGGPRNRARGALDPGFRAQELSFAAAMIADTLAPRGRRPPPAVVGASCSGAAPPGCPRRSCRRGRGSGRTCGAARCGCTTACAPRPRSGSRSS